MIITKVKKIEPLGPPAGGLGGVAKKHQKPNSNRIVNRNQNARSNRSDGHNNRFVTKTSGQGI